MATCIFLLGVILTTKSAVECTNLASSVASDLPVGAPGAGIMLAFADPQRTRSVPPQPESSGGAKPKGEKGARKKRGPGADSSHRAKFEAFSAQLGRLIDLIRSDALNAEKAAAVTGMKLPLIEKESDDLLLIFASNRFDDLWAYSQGPKASPRSPKVAKGDPLRGVQLRLPGPASDSKGAILQLTLEEGSEFTVSDFNNLFKQAANPEPYQHDVPLVAHSNSFSYKYRGLRIYITCEKETGFCRSIAIDTFKPQPLIPAVQEREKNN